MQSLRRIVTALLLLLIFICSIAFSLVNTSLVPLSLGWVSLAPQPVSVWVIAAFCLGALIGLVLGAGYFKDIQARRKVRKLQTEIAALEIEVTRLQAASSSRTGMHRETNSKLESRHDQR